MNSNLKGTHREKIPSNKTSMLSNIWMVGTLNPLFTQDSFLN